MTIISINVFAALVIFLWATWCVVSAEVHDGIVGKLLYAGSAIAAFAILANNATGHQPPGNEVALNCCMAGLALRHFFLRTYWPRIRCRLLGTLSPQRRESDGF